MSAKRTAKTQLGGMRDNGLQQAIDAAGGVAGLARKLGIAQPSVSNWTKVPPDRVIAVESMTGVGRNVLRPDLYPEAPPTVAEEDMARAIEYARLGALLRQAPTAAMLTELSRLKGDPSELGLLRMSLAEAAEDADADTESKEFFRLFVGVARGELLPYASYYTTGFLHERPLARVREDLKTLGIERQEGLYEPEDHLGILCDVMAGMAAGQFGDGIAGQKAFFTRHIEPWALRLFADLESAAETHLYKAVARMGAAFMAIESQSFALPD
jgi:TorA maturation chaperone TorD